MMNVIVHNRRNLYFQIPDLDVEIQQYEERTGVTLFKDLKPEIAAGLPRLPPKRWFYNKEAAFLHNRMKSLNKYLKALICIHEAIGCPILQRFLEIDIKFNPFFEYCADSNQPINNTNMRKQQVLKSKDINFGDEEHKVNKFLEEAIAEEMGKEVDNQGNMEDEELEDVEEFSAIHVEKREDADSIIFEESKDSHTSDDEANSALSDTDPEAHEEEFGMYIGGSPQEMEFGRYEDEYDQLEDSQCTGVQRMVKRVTHLSNFYTNEIIEYYGLIQQVQLMNGELENAKIEIEMQSKRFRELTQLINQYNSETPEA